LAGWSGVPASECEGAGGSDEAWKAGLGREAGGEVVGVGEAD